MIKQAVVADAAVVVVDQTLCKINFHSISLQLNIQGINDAVTHDIQNSIDLSRKLQFKEYQMLLIIIINSPENALGCPKLDAVVPKPPNAGVELPNNEGA